MIPDDGDLGRLLAEGLRRETSGGVDAGALVAGSRALAHRSRRRRRTAGLAAAVVLVCGVPASWVVLHVQSGAVSSRSAATAEAATGVADAAPSAASGEDRTYAESPAGTRTVTSSGRARTADGHVLVPDSALLTGADVDSGRLASDTGAEGYAADPDAAATCGHTVIAPAAGARARRFDVPGATTAATRSTTSAVRVYAGTGAADRLTALAAAGCLTDVGTPPGSGGRPSSGASSASDGATAADDARVLVGRSGTDSAGRTLWFAAARSGRVVTEVVVAVPVGRTTTAAEIVALLRTAQVRLADSGLVRSADADPVLG